MPKRQIEMAMSEIADACTNWVKQRDPSFTVRDVHFIVDRLPENKDGFANYEIRVRLSDN